MDYRMWIEGAGQLEEVVENKVYTDWREEAVMMFGSELAAFQRRVLGDPDL